MGSAVARVIPQTTNRADEAGRARVGTARSANEPGAGHAVRRTRRSLPPSRVPVRPRADRRPVPSGVRIGALGGRYEQEADRLADRVANRAGMAVASAVRADGPSAGPAPPSVTTAVSGAGRPLDPGLQTEMERRFGHDFSAVRIHSGSAAERSTRELGARAYTVGSDIVLGGSPLNPDTRAGRHLIAHELTHVVQQSGAAGHGMIVQRSPATDAVAHAPDPITEEEHADHAWHLVAKLPSKGRPFFDAIRAIVVENGHDVNWDVLEATSIRGYPRGRAVGGLIRPSYFACVHPTLGAVLRAFAVPSGIHPDRMPDPKTLREEVLDYEHYAFTPRAGDTRPTYAFPAPLSSAPKLSELDKPKPAHEPSEGENWDIAPQPYPENSLPYMMARWKAAGLLDGPRIKVRPIPPLPITKRELSQLKADIHHRGPPSGFVPVAGFVSAGAQLEPAAAATGAAADEAVAAAAERAAAGALVDESVTVVASAGADEAGVTIAAGGAGAAVAGATAFVAVMLYPSSIAPDPPFSDITGQPTTSLEHDWEGRLDPAQRDYLRDLWRLRVQPTPPPAPAKQTEPEPTTGTDIQPEPEDRRRQRKCSPTGLIPSDPIPIVWYKPLNSAMYPTEITVQGHAYRRDEPSRLPHGEPIGVRREYWPRIGKTFQLLPERRGDGADNFRNVLRGYGYDTTALGLQVDHVQDLQWEGPDVFENLWPLDMRQNMSAGARQNNLQSVSLCITPRGPYVTITVAEVKRMRGGYGRWFSIARVQY